MPVFLLAAVGFRRETNKPTGFFSFLIYKDRTADHNLPGGLKRLAALAIAQLFYTWLYTILQKIQKLALLFPYRNRLGGSLVRGIL